MNELLKGIPASKGIAQGKIRLIRNINDLDNFKEGEIIVSKTTDSSYCIVFSKAKAVITEYGGIMAHSAIIAREYEIPCVVKIEKATEILKTGEEVIVNGTNGTIQRI